MRGFPLALCAVLTPLLAPLPAVAGPYHVYSPPARAPHFRGVAVETVYLSRLPRRPGTVPSFDVGKVLIGAEAPARVDLYALTEDEKADVPLATIDRRVAFVPLRR